MWDFEITQCYFKIKKACSITSTRLRILTSASSLCFFKATFMIKPSTKTKISQAEYFTTKVN